MTVDTLAPSPSFAYQHRRIVELDATVRDLRAKLAAALAASRKMTVVERRGAVVAMLADPKSAGMSDREIARVTGASHPLVGKLRRELGPGTGTAPAPESAPTPTPTGPALTIEQQRLVIDNLNLARWYAAKFKTSHPDLIDDIGSAAMHGLCLAALMYDSRDRSRGAFSNRAVWEIRDAVGDLLRKEGRRGGVRERCRAVSLDCPIGDDDQPVGKMIADRRTVAPDYTAEMGDELAVIARAVEQLPVGEADAMRRHYGPGNEPIDSIAESSGVDRSTIQNRLSKARTTVRRLVANA